MKRLTILLVMMLIVAMTFFMWSCDTSSSSSSSTSTTSSGGCNGGTSSSSTSSTSTSTSSSSTSTSSSSSGSGAYVTTILQAENAAIVSGVVEAEHTGYTGSGYANTDNSAANYIEFALTATQADAYDLTFYYALESGNRYGSIQVNGSTQVSNIDFNGTGAWTTWATSSATVSLSSGANTIRVTAEQSGGLPNIDKMEVYGYAVTEDESSSSSSSSSGSSGITGASCVSTGSVTVSSTIVVSSGTYDGGCKTFNATSALGDGGQSEGQSPIFRVENGATLKNVILGSNGADGIHLYNSATVDNVTWTDVGEDAMTVKSSGNYYISNIEGYDAYDKFFQINAACNFKVTNAIIHRAGKALRQNGGTTFTINVTFDQCEIEDMKEAVFRSDSSSSTAKITNSRLHDAGDICYGTWGSCTYSGITYY